MFLHAAPTSIMLLLCSLGISDKILKVFLYWFLLNLAIENKSTKRSTMIPYINFLFFFYFLLMLNSYLSCDYFCLPFSINTVYYMAPFATMILAVPAMLLEGPGVIYWLQTHQSLTPALTIIFSSGVLAFCLNFSIFYVIHSTTAVTFNVAGNLKVNSVTGNNH